MLGGHRGAAPRGPPRPSRSVSGRSTAATFRREATPATLGSTTTRTSSQRATTSAVTPSTAPRAGRRPPRRGRAAPPRAPRGPTPASRPTRRSERPGEHGEPVLRRQRGAQRPGAQAPVRADQGVPRGRRSAGVEADHAGRARARAGRGRAARPDRSARRSAPARAANVVAPGTTGPGHHADGRREPGTAPSAASASSSTSQASAAGSSTTSTAADGQGAAEDAVAERPWPTTCTLVAPRRALRGEQLGRVGPDEHDRRRRPGAQRGVGVVGDVEGRARGSGEPQQVTEQRVVTGDQQGGVATVMARGGLGRRVARRLARAAYRAVDGTRHAAAVDGSPAGRDGGRPPAGGMTRGRRVRTPGG